MALSTAAQEVVDRIRGTRANADATGNTEVDELILLAEIADQLAT